MNGTVAPSGASCFVDFPAAERHTRDIPSHNLGVQADNNSFAFYMP
jgi:hypothetical protein